MATTIMAGAVTLTEKEMAIVDLGAAVARGEQDKVSIALKSGFDAGLTLNEAKELVGQLYAYCGFPRALNAAATLMETWGTGNGERGMEDGKRARCLRLSSRTTMHFATALRTRRSFAVRP